MDILSWMYHNLLKHPLTIRYQSYLVSQIMLRQASHEICFEGEGAYLVMYFGHHFTNQPRKDILKSWNTLE